MRDARLVKILWEILDDMYNNSTPPLDFKQFREDIKKKICPDRWWMNHVITSEKYAEIQEKHIKKNKLRSYERRRLAMDLLNYSPTLLSDKKDDGNEGNTGE